MSKHLPLPYLFEPDREPRRKMQLRPRRQPRAGRARKVKVWVGLLVLAAAASQLLRQPAAAPARAATLAPAAAKRTAHRVAGWRAAHHVPRRVTPALLEETPTLARPSGSAPDLGTVPDSGAWIEVWATAYCPTCTVCDTGTITKSGRHAWSRGLAVAARGRKVAPLGSHIYVPGFGSLLVDDTGGGVHADQIDIRMRSHRQAVQFGRRKIKVRLAVR